MDGAARTSASTVLSTGASTMLSTSGGGHNELCGRFFGEGYGGEIMADASQLMGFFPDKKNVGQRSENGHRKNVDL